MKTMFQGWFQAVSTGVYPYRQKSDFLSIIFLIHIIPSTAVILLAVTGGALPIPVATGPFLVLIPVAAGLLLGLIFSYLPARTAARIAPAEALRNE